MSSRAHISAALFIAAIMTIIPLRALCKDFPEPAAVADPLAVSPGPVLPAGFGAVFEYGNYLFAHDDIDSFYTRVGANPVLFNLGGRFALAGNYEAVLMCGPVPAGDTPANIAAFWMNAVQFEYGLYASLALGADAEGCLRLLAEYSRTSQHPLRPAYSEVAADILMLGVAAPERSLLHGAVELRVRGSLRSGWRGLFAFWESSLPQPRMSWTSKLAVEAELSLSGPLCVVARAYPEFFLDRYTNSIDANLFAEAGVSIGTALLRDEFLVTLYATRDSDMLDGAAHPAFEAGFALKLSTAR
jgi:hypothetical protein